MAFYRNTYPEAKVPIKMHLLEDHAVQWANTYHVGLWPFGRTGAESIHAKFNRLGLVYAQCVYLYAWRHFCMLWQKSNIGTLRSEGGLGVTTTNEMINHKDMN